MVDRDTHLVLFTVLTSDWKNLKMGQFCIFLTGIKIKSYSQVVFRKKKKLSVATECI